MARFFRTSSISALALLAAGWAGAAQAQTTDEIGAVLERMRGEIAEQARQIEAQEQQLSAQRAQLARQRDQLNRLQGLPADVLQTARGMGYVAPQEPTVQPATPGPQPQRPVGEAPPPPEPVEVAAVPEGQGVLTPRGQWVLEPSIDFTHGSSNRLVFRGVEIVTGIQVGVIEASDADRDASSAAIAVRTGLTNRLEVEVRVPYLYREDRVTTLVQREETATRTLELEGKGIGDVEFGVRYQLNSGRNGWPVFLAGLRAKSDTGSSPFEIDRDEFGVATELATGSGFWGVDGSLTFLYPTDPAVIYGGVSYLAHLPKDIDRTIGGALVGRVDPGDSIGVNFGFGFALNPRFSFSLGYRHNYIMETETELGTTKQRSQDLQVGAFNFGVSFRLNERVTIATTYEIGTTSDAPDMRLAIRLPIRF